MSRLTPEQKIVLGIGRGTKSIFRFLFGVKKGTGSRGIIDRTLVEKRWQEINEMVKLGGESRLRSAVVEADKLLDYALKARAYLGENMGERLKSAVSDMSKEGYNAAWEAHKLRNRIVHEIHHEIFHWDVQKAIRNFEKALRDLRAL